MCSIPSAGFFIELSVVFETTDKEPEIYIYSQFGCLLLMS